MFVVLNIICTFVEQNRFRRNSKIHIYDKSALKVHSTERAVIPFLKWFCTPKGALAYKFFKMQNKKNFVTDSQCVKVTSVQQNQTDFLNLQNRYAAMRVRYAHLFTF